MSCLLKDPSSPPEKDYYLGALFSTNSSKTKIIWRTHLYFVVTDKLIFSALSPSGIFPKKKKKDKKDKYKDKKD